MERKIAKSIYEALELASVKQFSLDWDNLSKAEFDLELQLRKLRYLEIDKKVGNVTYYKLSDHGKKEWKVMQKKANKTIKKVNKGMSF